MSRRDCPSCNSAWHSSAFFDAERIFECPECGSELIVPNDLGLNLERLLRRDVDVRLFPGPGEPNRPE